MQAQAYQIPSLSQAVGYKSFLEKYTIDVITRHCGQKRVLLKFFEEGYLRVNLFVQNSTEPRKQIFSLLVQFSLGPKYLLTPSFQQNRLLTIKALVLLNHIFTRPRNTRPGRLSLHFLFPSSVRQQSLHSRKKRVNLPLFSRNEDGTA